MTRPRLLIVSTGPATMLHFLSPYATYSTDYL